MNTVRHISVLALLVALVLSGCSSTRKVYEDDVYFNLDDADREARTYNENNRKKSEKTDVDQYSTRNSGSSESSSYSTDENGNIVIKNNYYDDSQFSYDDYYDYSYTSRLRRFHQDNAWNYYDPYYTNYYWYNNNPYYFGNSVYSTYTWWGPSYGWNYSASYWNVTYSWGSPWYGYGYSSWYNPWANPWYGGSWWNPYDPWCYGGGFGCGPYYGYGYGAGMWGGGYYGGGMYFNSYDNNSYYYGPRTFANSNNNTRVDFAKIMQDNGIKQDLTVRPVNRNPNVNTINRSSLDKGNVTSGEQPTDRGNVNTGSNTGTPNTAGTNRSDRYTTITRDDVNTGTNNTGSVNTPNNTNSRNNTVIITNEDNSGRYIPNTSGTNSGNTNNNSSIRRWDNNDNDVKIIERNGNSGQRSGTFSEGSRSSGQNNYNYYNNNNGGSNDRNNGGFNNNSVPQQNYQQRTIPNNSGGGNYSPRPNTNSNPRQYSPR